MEEVQVSEEDVVRQIKRMKKIKAGFKIRSSKKEVEE